MRDPNDFVLHFGCRNKPGHHLTFPNGMSVRQFEADNMRVPRDNEFDGSNTFLPFPERPGYGSLTYLPANDRTVLAWWDRTFDGRPGCNMAVIATGNLTLDEIWSRFSGSFADLAPKLTKPTLNR